MSDHEPCSQGCGRQATGVVVSVNGWVIEVCGPCARAACDPLWSDVTAEPT